MPGGITVRKAGEAVAKAVAGKAAAAAPVAQVPLRPPRAVTAAEAPIVLPARESTKTTMMPWKGWFDRFLKDNLSAGTYRKMRETLFFMPNDIYDLQQSPIPNKKIPAADPKYTHMYRYPSPGSQEPVSQPEFDIDCNEDPYDNGYFKRDTRRRYESSELGNPAVEKMKLQLMDPNDPRVQEDMKAIEEGPESSPGNKGRFATGPSDFDPTGLRATMSVTWDKLEESLDEHMPDHLPEPVWFGHEEEIIKWHEERDLPVPVGGYYKALKVPYERRVAMW